MLSFFLALLLIPAAHKLVALVVDNYLRYHLYYRERKGRKERLSFFLFPFQSRPLPQLNLISLCCRLLIQFLFHFVHFSPTAPAAATWLSVRFLMLIGATCRRKVSPLCVCIFTVSTEVAKTGAQKWLPNCSDRAEFNLLTEGSAFFSLFHLHNECSCSCSSSRLKPSASSSYVFFQCLTWHMFSVSFFFFCFMSWHAISLTHSTWSPRAQCQCVLSSSMSTRTLAAAADWRRVLLFLFLCHLQAHQRLVANLICLLPPPPP